MKLSALLITTIPMTLASTAFAAPTMTQILGQDAIARYKRSLPRVAWPQLQAVLDSPQTFWFDKETMIPSYQDSVGDGSFTPIGARPNANGKAIIVPEGVRLFSDDGETWNFPFAHTAGLDRSTNSVVINFMNLPIDARDEFMPVVYDTIDNPSALGGLGLHQWKWMFPKGTMFGEVIFIRDSAGDLYPVEVRTRVRYLEGWATNAFRPFPTAGALVDAIKRVRPDFASNATLAAFVAHLQTNTTLAPKTLTSPEFNDILTVTGNLDVLPALGDETLVKELLGTTKFSTAYGEIWKADGAATSYAASTTESFSVVPTNYEAGLFEVREATCQNCHRDAGRSINDFEEAAVLYGDIWGEDQIFSFHPWDQSRFPTFNTENRSVRPELANIVVPYDASIHAADIYNELH